MQFSHDELVLLIQLMVKDVVEKQSNGRGIPHQTRFETALLQKLQKAEREQ